jgi:uncharacterized cupredoxin-like copper-binding protein
VRIHRMTVLGLVMVLMLVVAACNGDDDDVIDPAVTDDTEEVTPPVDDDDAVTPEVDDEETPEMTPEMTPEATPEDDEMTPEATPEDEVTPEATPEDEATPDTDVGVTDRLMVEVTLTEMEIELEYDDNGIAAELDPTDGVMLPSGNITFQITNDGDMPHSLAIVREDDDTIPTNDIPEYELDETLEPGESTQWEVELEPGTYIFYCPVGDHRDQGMEIEVTVEEDDEDDQD